MEFGAGGVGGCPTPLVTGDEAGHRALCLRRGDLRPPQGAWIRKAGLKSSGDGQGSSWRAVKSMDQFFWRGLVPPRAAF